MEPHLQQSLAITVLAGCLPLQKRKGNWAKNTGHSLFPMDALADMLVVTPNDVQYGNLPWVWAHGTLQFMMCSSPLMSWDVLHQIQDPTQTPLLPFAFKADFLSD